AEAVQLHAVVPIASAPIVSRPSGAPAEAARKGDRQLWRPGGWVTAPVYDREALAPGATLAGPALVDGVDTTIVVPDGFTLSVDEYATAVLEADR
ncbi:MAG: hydantoinase/oxoprolinase family protein, partial [Acidimicrobiia bacterium]